MFEKHSNIDAIIHFAASKAVGDQLKNLCCITETTWFRFSLVAVMPIHKVKNIVFSSSCTVYGQPSVLPVTESAPIKPALSPYGNTKQIGEEIIRDTIHANPFYKSIILRYFNPIGAHPSAEIGELPNGVPNNLLPFVTQTAIGLRKQLQVFGNDYNTPDGSCIRDYIHVVDLAKAHVIAVQRMLNNESNQHVETFNLGTGRGLRFLKYWKHSKGYGVKFR